MLERVLVPENRSAADYIIVALDCDRERALEIADELAGQAVWVKVGMTLFYRHGPEIVHELKERGFKVFVDLKLHDIPHQVNLAMSELGRLGADLLTLHASGGSDMINAAVQGAALGAQEGGCAVPAVIGVTVLTSSNQEMLSSIGVEHPVSEQVDALAGLVWGAGASGVVCSPLEATQVSHVLGNRAFIVTPGVRPAGSAKGDQSRVATPAKAIASGSTHLVIGRPITQAENVLEAFQLIEKEVQEAI